MARLLLFVGLLLTPLVASSFLNDEAGCDDWIEAEYNSNDFGCPFSWSPYQSPQIPYGCSVPSGIAYPCALPPTACPYTQVSANYGRLQGVCGFNPASKSAFLANGQNTWFPYSYGNSEDGSGLSIVSAGNTEIIGDYLNSQDGRPVNPEDTTRWYPNEGVFMNSPATQNCYGYDKNYLFPYTYGYPEFDRSVDSCYRIPPFNQRSSSCYDYGYGLFNPQLTPSKYIPNINQYGSDYEPYSPTLCPSAIFPQDGYPGYYNQETSDLSFTDDVHNGYAIDDDYMSPTKHYYPYENFYLEPDKSSLGYGLYDTEHPTLKIPSSTSINQKEFPKSRFDGLSSQHFNKYPKLNGFGYGGLGEEDSPSIYQSHQKRIGHSPYIPTQGPYGYEQISSEQEYLTEDGINIYNKQEYTKGPIEISFTEYNGDNIKEQTSQGIETTPSDYFNEKLPETNPPSTDPAFLDYYRSNLQIHENKFKNKHIPGSSNKNGYTTNGIHNTISGNPYQTGLYGPSAALSLEAEVSASQQVIKLFDGCSVTRKQLEDIIESFQVPEDCMLTVPHMFTGPLVQFAHVMNCFPDSLDVYDGFVHLPCGLVVPYHCYKHIASIYASDLPLFQDTSGVILYDGQVVDFHIVASIVACSRTPERLFIITCNNLVIPYEIFKNYISQVTAEDKKNLFVLLPGIKEPIRYNIYKEIFDLYVGKFHNNAPLDKNKTVKLLGSKIELSLEQFLSVLENYHAIKNAIVTLPSKKTMPLTSFIHLAPILGDDFTRTCFISIPNTPFNLPFTVLREICGLYLGRKTFDLSKDTDVNWNSEIPNVDGIRDVEIFSTLDKVSPKYIPSDTSAKVSVSILNGEISSQEPQYLLCHKQTPPYHNFYNVGGILDLEGWEAFDKRNPYDTLFIDPLKVQKYGLSPVATEPIYACQRFEKYPYVSN